ncbi:MAG: ATP-binding protein [Proteobacteria bacterium]|nr:ATP-binding protein [Pseudomonadota bacterium]
MDKLVQSVFSKVAIHGDFKVKDLYSNFMSGAIKDSVAVVDQDNFPIGLVVKQKFLMKLSERYAFDLYYKKDVKSIMIKNPLIIDCNEDINTIIDKALSRESENVYDEIIMVDGEKKFYGLLSVKELIIQQANNLANIILQKEIAHSKAKELEEINNIKNQFLANVTHELRSPINIIIGIIELIKKAYENKEFDKIQLYLKMIQNSANNLKIIVNNILDLSKIEAGKMEIINEEFKVGELLRDIVEYTKVLIKEKNVDTVISLSNPDLVIKSDYVKLRQILINLISNSAKFTEQGYIKISQELENDHLIISVADTGCGIKEEDLKKLFNAFTQLEDAKTKRYEGTGLGLTIVKKLTELLNGKVYVESVWGKGTTFTIVLPKF